MSEIPIGLAYGYNLVEAGPSENTSTHFAPRRRLGVEYVDRPIDQIRYFIFMLLAPNKPALPCSRT